MILDIEGIEEPTFNKDTFDYLVLDPKIKDTVRALAVNSYKRKTAKREKTFSADFIRGKGEGQVILLHGPPGVGKTCTAGQLVL